MSFWDNVKATFRNIATVIARIYLGISEDEIIRNWQAYHHQALARKIDGYSLEDIISTSDPRYVSPEKEILLEKFQNLENALLKLLEKGWVHRDLNLGNIMFDNNTQEFIVIDFDLYRRFDATKNHPHLNQFVEEIKRIVAITQKQVLSIY